MTASRFLKSRRGTQPAMPAALNSPAFRLTLPEIATGDALALTAGEAIAGNRLTLPEIATGDALGLRRELEQRLEPPHAS